MTLTFLGYFLGDNQALIKEYLQQITIGTIVFIVLLTLLYIKKKR